MCYEFENIRKWQVAEIIQLNVEVYSIWAIFKDTYVHSMPIYHKYKILLLFTDLNQWSFVTFKL